MARMSGECLPRRSLEIVEASDHLSSGSTELHVLAVDDSFVDRKVIERLFKISSCRVTAVESGRRALQYLGLDGEKNSVGFDALKVNLIMTDYSMPGMTGYELLKKIKESSTLREIPVVVMSSENILARIDRCLKEGAEDFLVKPVQLSDVKRLKDFILRGQGEENGKKRSHKRKLQDDFMPSSLQTNQPSTSMLFPLPPSLQSPSKRPSSQPSTSTPCPLLPSLQFPSKLPSSQPSTSSTPCPLSLSLSPHSKWPRL